MMFSLILAAALLTGGVRQSPVTTPGRIERARMDQPVRDFSLADIMPPAEPGDGKTAPPVSLSQFRGHSCVVLIFLSEQCSMVWRYEARIGRLIGMLKKRGDSVLGVRCSATDTPSTLRSYAESKNFAIPILNDAQGELTRYFFVFNTPVFVVLDKQGVMRYKGSLDESPRADLAQRNFVTDALTAIDRNVPVTTKLNRPFGCDIAPIYPRSGQK